MFCVGDLRFFSACVTLLQGLGFLKRTLRFCGRSCFWRRSAASVEGERPAFTVNDAFSVDAAFERHHYASFAGEMLPEEKCFAFRGDGLFFEAFCFFALLSRAGGVCVFCRGSVSVCLLPCFILCAAAGFYACPFLAVFRAGC